jgi:sugar phosphate isomerase/epimerase
MLGYYTPETVAGLKRIADGDGLRLTNFFFNLPFSYEAEAPRSKVNLDAFKKAADVVVRLGSPIITSMTPYPFQSAVRHMVQRPASCGARLSREEPQAETVALAATEIVDFRATMTPASAAQADKCFMPSAISRSKSGVASRKWDQ